MKGWDSIPDGYGAVFEIAGAPLAARVLLRIPFLDRFAYPMMVRAGCGYLIRHPGARVATVPPDGGWTVVSAEQIDRILPRDKNRRTPKRLERRD